MALFFKYVKARSRLILLAALCGLAYAAVLALYQVPLIAAVYPALLCVCISAPFAVLDFLKTKRRHELLSYIKTQEAQAIDALPEAGGMVDEDYQAVILSLQSQALTMESEFDRKYHDMIEYYSLWAHQIKTPIAAMRLKLQSEDTPAARQLLAELFRVEQYVQMVLAFLRLDAPSKDYVFREYEVDAIIRQAVKKFAHEFIGRNIRLCYEPVSLSIVTDEKWLGFVLEQIISNALKYTQTGCVKIYRQAPEILCIEDTGIGIAPEDLPRIFEKGYTGLNGRYDRKASGIGLYLCKRVCDHLGIALKAESRMGVGTIMRLNLSQYKPVRE